MFLKKEYMLIVNLKEMHFGMIQEELAQQRQQLLG